MVVDKVGRGLVVVIVVVDVVVNVSVKVEDGKEVEEGNEVDDGNQLKSSEVCTSRGPMLKPEKKHTYENM